MDTGGVAADQSQMFDGQNNGSSQNGSDLKQELMETGNMGAGSNGGANNGNDSVNQGTEIIFLFRYF